MADITIQCAKCSTQIRISEYASPEGLVCHSCGSPLPMPVRDAAARPDGIRLRDPRPPPAPAASPTETVVAAYTRRRRRRRSRAPIGLPHRILSWSLFLALGAALALIRYRNLVPAPQMAILVTAALSGAGYLHVLVVAMAFRDDFFEGILCLLVPGYSVYFLFAVSDAYYLRAVAGALLVAFGPDIFVFIRDNLLIVYRAVSDWLQRGGG